MKNFYETLGVSENSSADEIKKAYRTLSKQYHPDVNPNNQGAEEKFKEINEAYSILSDEKKRIDYDQKRKFGNSRFGGGDFRGSDRWGSPNYGFEEFFGFRKPNVNKPKARGSDLKIHLDFTLEEVMFGAIKKIQYKRMVFHNECGGNGSLGGKSNSQCSACQGQGYANRIIQTPFGNVESTELCRACSGKGYRIINLCHGCGGRGLIEHSEDIELNIPPGIIDGFTYNIQKGGNHSNTKGGIIGNLIVQCFIVANDNYKIKNTDIHRDIFISYLDAILGNDNFVVKHLDNNLSIKINPKTTSGEVLRLRGCGLPSMKQKNMKGDLYLYVNIYFPKDFSENDIEKLKSLESKFKPEENNLNFTEGILYKSMKIKDLFA